MPDASKETIQALQMLEQNEREVASLYGHFAKKFPELSEFWKARMQDELRHAGFIKAVFDKAVSGNACGGGRTFPVVEIKYCLKKVKNFVDHAERQEMSLNAAFTRALETERDMLERHLFDLRDGDDPEIMDLLTKLKADTEYHMGEFRKALEKISGG
jgi:rubrerythrin